MAHRCTHQGGGAGQWHRENRSRDDREAQRTVRPTFMGVGAGRRSSGPPHPTGHCLGLSPPRLTPLPGNGCPGGSGVGSSTQVPATPTRLWPGQPWLLWASRREPADTMYLSLCSAFQTPNKDKQKKSKHAEKAPCKPVLFTARTASKGRGRRPAPRDGAPSTPAVRGTACTSPTVRALREQSPAASMVTGGPWAPDPPMGQSWEGAQGTCTPPPVQSPATSRCQGP